MAMIAGDSFLTRKFYVVTPPGTSGTAVWTTGFPVRDDTLIKVSSTTSTTVSSVTVTSTGIKHTYIAKYITPFNITVAPRYRARIRWQVTTAWTGTGGPPQGRFNFDVQKTGVAITNLVKATGAAQLLNGIATFTDSNATTTAGNSTTFTAGTDTIDLRFEFDVSTASTTDTQAPAILLQHDPAVAGNELIVEVDL